MRIAPRPAAVAGVAVVAALGLAVQAAGSGGLAGAVPVALAAALALAMAVDLALSLAQPTPELRLRSCGQPSLGKRFTAVVEITETAGRPRPVELSLDEPPGLRWDPGSARGLTDPGRPVPLELSGVASRRGPCTVERAWLRFPSRLGLLSLTLARRLDAGLSVLPSLADLSSARAFARASGESRGTNRRRLGADQESGERYGLREYSPGEDARRIDWKASARHRVPLVRLSVPEDDALVAFAIDAGRLMTSERGGRSALDLALSAFIACGDAALAAGDRVCATLFADGILARMDPVRSRASLPRLAAFAAGASARPADPDFPALAAHLRRRLPKRSLVVIVTEASETMPLRDLESAVASLAGRHSVAVAFIRDEGLEAMASDPAPGRGVAYRAAAAAEILGFRDRAAGLLSRKASVTVSSPAELAIDLTRLYVEAKARNLV